MQDHMEGKIGRARELIRQRDAIDAGPRTQRGGETTEPESTRGGGSPKRSGVKRKARKVRKERSKKPAKEAGARSCGCGPKGRHRKGCDGKPAKAVDPLNPWNGK